MGTIEVHIAFRAGFRWPLRHGDVVELWDGMTLLGTLSAVTVLSLVGHHYANIKLQERMRDELNGHRLTASLSPDQERKPPAKALPVTRERRDELRTKRRSRRKA